MANTLEFLIDGDVVTLSVDAEGNPVTTRRKDRSGENAAAALSGIPRRFVDNIFGLPEFLDKGLAAADNAVNRGAADIFGQRAADFLLGPQRESLALPEADEVFAAVDAGARAPFSDQDFSTLFDEQLQTRKDLATDNPVATMLGEFGGDVATLMTGRVQTKGAPRTGAGGIFDKPIADTIKKLSNKRAAGIKPGVPGGVAKQTKTILDSELFQNSMRGIGRSLETGLEGAALEMMQDGDPIETLGLAMGGQLAASSALSFAGGAIELPLKALNSPKLGALGEKALGLAFQGAVLTGLFQALQYDTAEAEETAFNKLTTSIVLGATLGLTGKRTKVEGLGQNFPRLADTILTIPRTGMLKAAQALAEDEEVMLVARTMSQNPMALSEEQMDALASGIEGGDLPGTVDKLAQDPEFREATGITREIEFLPAGDNAN